MCHIDGFTLVVLKVFLLDFCLEFLQHSQSFSKGDLCITKVYRNSSIGRLSDDLAKLRSAYQGRDNLIEIELWSIYH